MRWVLRSSAQPWQELPGTSEAVTPPGPAGCQWHVGDMEMMDHRATPALSVAESLPLGPSQPGGHSCHCPRPADAALASRVPGHLCSDVAQTRGDRPACCTGAEPPRPWARLPASPASGSSPGRLRMWEKCPRPQPCPPQPACPHGAPTWHPGPPFRGRFAGRAAQVAGTWWRSELNQSGLSPARVSAGLAVPSSQLRRENTQGSHLGLQPRHD